MKKLLFLLGCLSYGFTMAQDCRQPTLMQKGAQLEYKIDGPALGTNSRLLFIVDEVQDSAGITRSTIIKSVLGVSSRKKRYDKKIVLQCDGRSLFIPFDFYLSDTLYTKDIYPNENKANPYYVLGFKPMSDTIAYNIPLMLDCIVNLPEFKRQVVRVAKIGYVPIGYCMKPPDYKTEEFNLEGISVEGKEMVTTAAGTFACYKLIVKIMDAADNSFIDDLYLYYNKEIGLVKYKEPVTTVELISIRK